MIGISDKACSLDKLIVTNFFLKIEQLAKEAFINPNFPGDKYEYIF